MIAGVEPLRGGLWRRLKRQGQENLQAVCTIGDQGRAGTRRKDEHKYPQRQHDRGPARRRKGTASLADPDGRRRGSPGCCEVERELCNGWRSAGLSDGRGWEKGSGWRYPRCDAGRCARCDRASGGYKPFQCDYGELVLGMLVMHLQRLSVHRPQTSIASLLQGVAIPLPPTTSRTLACPDGQGLSTPIHFWWDSVGIRCQQPR